MRKLVLALTMVAAFGASAQATTILDDPLHGFCVGCSDNGTNTPIQQNNNGTVEQFGFTASPANSGLLQLDVLIPNNTSFTIPTVTGSGVNASPTLFSDGFGTPGLTVWTAGGVEGTNPTLAGFLQNNASPDQNLDAYLPSTQAIDPGATGFLVLTLNAGLFSLPTPGNTPPDLFDLSNVLPGGSYIVGFLLDTSQGTIGTANSAALLVEPAAVVTPLPAAAWVFAGGLALFGGLYRKRKVA